MSPTPHPGPLVFMTTGIYLYMPPVNLLKFGKGFARTTVKGGKCLSETVRPY